MTSPPAGQSALAPCLLKLTSLGLVRPAHVLMTEYLSALAAEEVIDRETAARVAAAYHALHYGAARERDADVLEAVARLEAASAALAAMPESARHILAERLDRRLQGQFTSQGPPPDAAPPVQPAPARLDWGSMGMAVDRPSDSAHDGGAPPPADLLPAAEAGPATRPRAVRIRSLPIETVTLIVVALVVAGYVLRGGAEQSIGQIEAEATTSAHAAGQPPVIARDVWKNDDYWAANLRRRALTEAAHKRDRSARLAYELLLSDFPRDAEALNDLAWLHLTSDDPEIRDSKRGLDLALRAVALSRTPSILDTAAEARFQTGQPDEAVRLEQEALDSLPRTLGFGDRRFAGILQRQLEKFQKAAKSTPLPVPSAPAS